MVAAKETGLHTNLPCVLRGSWLLTRKDSTVTHES